MFLLQRVDTSNAGSPSVSVAKTPKTTTTVKPRSSTTTTTLPAAPLKTPDLLKVLVLNGGAKSGAAATMRTKLESEGYTNQPQANTWTGHSQTGNTLMCKAGLDREKVALSQQAALQGAKVVAFRDVRRPRSARMSTASSSSAP